jgi:hypothetical protein
MLNFSIFIAMSVDTAPGGESTTKTRTLESQANFANAATRMTAPVKSFDLIGKLRAHLAGGGECTHGHNGFQMRWASLEPMSAGIASTPDHHYFGFVNDHL